jgi:hypothetical protein
MLPLAIIIVNIVKQLEVIHDGFQVLLMFFVHFRLCFGIQHLLFILLSRRRISMVLEVSYLAKLMGPFCFDIVD